MEVVVRTAKNGRVKIPVREHRKPDVPSRSWRPVADADVCWWQLKSSAQNALQHLRRRRRHKKPSSSTIPNLKRSDVWVNGKLPLFLLTAIHSSRFDTDRFLLILKQTCHCATWFLTELTFWSFVREHFHFHFYINFKVCSLFPSGTSESLWQ